MGEPCKCANACVVRQNRGQLLPTTLLTGPRARIGPGQYRRALCQSSSLVHCGLPQTRLVQIATVNILALQMRRLRFRGLSDLAKSY